MYAVTLDFETRDPNIALKKGAGWVFKDFDILGAAYKIDDSEPRFTSNMDEVRNVVASSKTIICHNAQYDVGCLHRLGISYSDKTIVDTVILAKLYDNTLFQYGLDSLSSDFLGKNKSYDLLLEAFPGQTIKKLMSNMDLLFSERPDLVEQYAKQDVELTYKLAQWYKRSLYDDGLKLVPMYSDLIKAFVLWRSKGVRIDLAKAERSSAALHALEIEARERFKSYCGDINIESTKQLSEAFRNLGLVPGTSDKGGDSVDSKWRSLQRHPAIDALDDAKKYQKLRRDFVEGSLSRAEDGRIYPEMNILGASETGRFSSSNPNIQQLPKRDPISSELVRSIFIPEDGCRWSSLDFSSQEPRLQVAYAYLSECRGSDKLLDAFLLNAKHDLHQQVADLAGIDRKTAKTINLGISYGMGVAKLATSLKLDEESAKRLMKQYNKLTPYLSQLNKKVRESAEKKGYVKTLAGRRLQVDMSAPYKALNKLIQGSAADQTTLCLVQAYREGLPVMFSVHDSIELSISSNSQAERMKSIMEQSYGLPVPFHTDILFGNNWGDC